MLYKKNPRGVKQSSLCIPKLWCGIGAIRALKGVERTRELFHPEETGLRENEKEGAISVW